MDERKQRDETGQTTPGSTGRRLAGPFNLGYDPASRAIGNYRVDPAPPTVVPRLTEERAIAAVEHSANASFLRGGTGTVIARFGLFTGQDAAHQNGSYVETLPIDGRPAWLVVVPGVLMTPSGGGMRRGGRPEPIVQYRGWTLIVVYDDTEELHATITQTTQDPGVA